MAWDDMYRRWALLDLMLLKVKNRSNPMQREHVLEPCVWAYSGNSYGFDMTITEA